MIESLAKKEGRTYQVTCTGPCRGVTAKISSRSGDADLYAEEAEPPVIRVKEDEIISVTIVHISHVFFCRIPTATNVVYASQETLWESIGAPACQQQETSMDNLCIVLNYSFPVNYWTVYP